MNEVFTLWDTFLREKIAAIPDKQSFRIGEVAEICNVKPFVLRYWETEFTQFTPKKQDNNQRFYTVGDVQNFLLLKKLLHKDRYSIEGATKILSSIGKNWINHKIASEKKPANVKSFMNAEKRRFRNDCNLLLSEIRNFRSWVDSNI